MSDFTVNATCPVCKTRFAMDDGVPCDCLTPVVCSLCGKEVEEEDAAVEDGLVYHDLCLMWDQEGGEESVETHCLFPPR